MEYLREAYIKTLGYIHTEAPGVPPVFKGKEKTKMCRTFSTPEPGFETVWLYVLFDYVTKMCLGCVNVITAK